MTEPEDPSRERLKHHFAQRVIHQARHILEIWQRLQRCEWSATDMADLNEANLRLLRFAERFEQHEHTTLARSINQAMLAIDDNRGRLSSELISELNRLMHRLSRTGLRHGDQLDQTLLPPPHKPIYVMLQDVERAERLATQLEFFGLVAQAQPSVAAFRSSMEEMHPAAIVMDVDFGGCGAGLSLAAQLQEGLAPKLPLLFFSLHETDTPTRLAAVRAGGQEFLTGTLEASSLLEKIEILTCVAQYEPFKVLIIDDSRAQAMHTERLLNSAGIVTRTLIDPIQAMAELADFQPDLIILDMYMPACTGTELAKVIRHNDRYVSVLDHLPVGRGRPGQATRRYERGWRRLPDQADPFAPPDHHGAQPRGPGAQPQVTDGARQPDRALQPHAHPATAGRLQLPRPPRRQAAELRHA